MQSISSRSSISLSGRSSAAAAGKTRRAQQQQQQRAVVVVAKASANNDDGNNSVSLGRRLQQAAMSIAAGAVIATAPPSMARLEGVNNPQMLPAGPPQEVLDVAGYLTKGEIVRLTQEVKNLEKDTGWRVRVLAQAYPNTPGLAVKDYWAVDDNTVAGPTIRGGAS